MIQETCEDTDDEPLRMLSGTWYRGSMRMRVSASWGTGGADMIAILVEVLDYEDDELLLLVGNPGSCLLPGVIERRWGRA